MKETTAEQYAQWTDKACQHKDNNSMNKERGTAEERACSEELEVTEYWKG